jgi:hypothetical protein
LAESTAGRGAMLGLDCWREEEDDVRGRGVRGRRRLARGPSVSVAREGEGVPVRESPGMGSGPNLAQAGSVSLWPFLLFYFSFLFLFFIF